MAKFENKDIFLKTKELKKSFAGNVVLQNISFAIRPGEFIGLVGENGAGKSTLINLLTGVYQADSGSITIGKEILKGLTPAEAIRYGIHVIHQELSLSPNLSISQNIFLGKELSYGMKILDIMRMKKDTEKLLKSVGLNHLHPDTPVLRLTLAEQQLVEFLKATYQKPKLLILDEATSALATDQVETMFRALRLLCDEGMAAIYVSHRMQELFDICDNALILKDGKHVTTRPLAELDDDTIVSLITGREFEDLFPAKPLLEEVKSRPEVLKIDHMKMKKLEDISFSVHKGEILGIGGLQGQGQQQLMGALFGQYKLQKGTITLNDKNIKINHPKHAMSLGISYLPEDRKTEGLFLTHSIRYNLSFANLLHISSGLGTVKKKHEKSTVLEAMKRLNVKAVNEEQQIGDLSGGNQQKVALAKWLEINPNILLLNEPTRGIDVGTKQEIYELLRSIAAKGITILVISSSTLELIGLCDRVMVLYEHRISEMIEGDDLTEENIVKASVISKG